MISDIHFQNYIDNMTCFLDITPACPQPLLSLVNRLMNKEAFVTGMKFRHELGNMDFYSPRMIWLWPWLSAQSASIRGQCCAPNMDHSPRWSASYTLAGWLYWTTSIIGGAVFCSYQTGTYSNRIRICPSCMQCFYQNYLLQDKNDHLPSASTRMKSLATAVTDLQHTQKGVQGNDQEWGTLCSVIN